MAISFLRPELLTALILVPLVWFVPRRLRSLRLGLLRTAVMMLVVLALARPVFVSTESGEHQVVVLDMSASVAPEVREQAADTLKTIVGRMPGSARRSLVLVAGNEKELVDSQKQFADVIRIPGTAGGSPLALALGLAARCIPEGDPGAVTLVSDGLATDLHWGSAMQELSEREIPLHTVALDAIPSDIRPVGMATLQELQVGQAARVFVDVLGGPCDVLVTLSGPQGVLAESGPLRCDRRLRVELEFEPREAGFLRLEAEVAVTAGKDSHPNDNKLARTFAVQDPFRVLYLGERMQAGSEQLQKLLDAGFEFEEAGNLEGGGAPDLEGYDVVILDDKPAASMRESYQRELVAAVKDHGLGLFASGGGGAFGPGGYHKTPLASVLPVEFVQKEEKKDPSTALAIIIDTSGSMGGNRIILAKEVTRLAIRRLLPHDKIGIVEFYGNKRWASPLQSAANAIDIQRALNRLDAGGGTILLPAIEEAYYGMRNVQTRYKHVLVLTDAGVETGPYESLLRRMARDGICVSTVLVGPGRHSEFLVQMANWGNGRYYNASNRFNLPEIMLKQPSTARLPAWRPGSHPLTPRGGPGWWGDVDPADTPAIGGYVETRGRPGAEVLLETTRDAHPVLASWRFGLGRVTAFMSEPAGEGTRTWRDWDGYGPFLARVLARTAGESRMPFEFRVDRNDHRVTLAAIRRERSNVRPRVTILKNAARKEQEVIFRERADGNFSASFIYPPDREIRALGGTDDPARSARFRLVSDAHADVAAELQVDPLQAFDLERAARVTSGLAVRLGDLNGFEPAVGGGTRPVRVLALWPYALLAALLFYLAEIAWRRLPARLMTD